MNAPKSLQDKIAQLIFVRFGSNMPPKIEATDDFHRVAKLVEQHHLGGVLLFNGGTAENATTAIARLQALSPIPLTVAADMERGLAQQITDLAAWPHSLAFDALGDEAVAAVEEFARLSCLEARAIGVHVTFSPVADIHRNPENPIIANRAFGTTAERTSELAAAYVRGCHAASLLCCAKHFPGHGNTFADSHAELPVVSDSLETLTETDLRPFRELLDANVDMFMTAHVAYPALDASGTPATLSQPILTTLLRDEWGYEGAVVSDSLKMDGVKSAGKSESQLAVEAIRAGVDLLLDVSDVADVIDHIERAAEADELFAERVESAYARAWKVKLSAHDSKLPAHAANRIDSNEHSVEVARAALQVTHDDHRISLPISNRSKAGFLLANPLGDNAYTKTNRILQLIRSYDQVNCVHVLGPDAVESDSEFLAASLRECDVCVFALVVKPSAWQLANIPTWQQHLIQETCRHSPSIVASLGVAELLDDYPNAALKMVSFSDVPAAQTAVVKRIFGT